MLGEVQETRLVKCVLSSPIVQWASQYRCALPCRDNEFTINAFLAPQMLLMTVPIIGPIVFVPVQAASAWLVDLLARRSAGQVSQQPYNGRSAGPSGAPAAYDSIHPSRSAAASMSQAAPTVPASPPIFDQESYPQPHVAHSSCYQQQ